MSGTFTFELVSPERLVLSMDALSVQVPGSEGDFTVLARHAPTMASLRPGIVTVEDASKSKQRIFVADGFADVSNTGLTLLAGEAIPVSDLTDERLNAEIDKAQTLLRDAVTDEGRRAADARLAALRQVSSV